MILYYDCFSGISGDMNLGAMVDLGVDSSYLINELKKLDLNNYSISFTKDKRKGISGTRAHVIIQNEHKHADHKHENHHHEHHEHKHHNHERNFADIRNLIEKSSLNANIQKLSIDIFQKIAEAEAKVHDKPIDEIHFHEVGAVDSIVDIVGAAICIDFLKPDKIISSSLELGGGFVTCAHGTFPVPAPATLEILKGKPVKLGAVNAETTTPTGAAIIATLVTEFTDKPILNITKIAYGIGHNDNEIPNVLRLCSAEPIAEDKQTSTSTMIECNIDDMNPELYEYVMDKLFEAGAEDVFFQSILMKKTRPAIKISVLCQPVQTNNMEYILLTETSTLGLRKYNVQKTMLHRTWETLDTKWGKIRIKHGYLNNKIIKSKPEYEDCLKISQQNNVPISFVYQEIDSLMKH
jgi:pyridinium-3,5-bisthiocarboxylic acid mononucleotide nickel chelatase